MHRRMKDGARAVATAVGVAAGFMALASTAQTPDGFVHASFGGPLDVFAKTPSDVLAIGDGASDPTELATLLKGPGPATGAAPPTSYRVAVEAGSTPGTTTISVFPTTDPSTGMTAAPATKVAGMIPAKPVVDSQGRVDCTGSVSCKTDPVTNVTTVTYPDGVVAIVQKVNDLTVVAYKTLTEALPAELRTLMPPVPTLSAAPTVPSVAPVDVPATTAPVLLPPSPEVVAPAIDPGPPAPETAALDPDDMPSVPKVSVTKTPLDFGSDQGPAENVPAPSGPANLPGKVKDALGSVVKSVTDAVGKVVSPGASGRDTTTPGKGAGRQRAPKSATGVNGASAGGGSAKTAGGTSGTSTSGAGGTSSTSTSGAGGTSGTSTSGAGKSSAGADTP
ncbi:MAG: hypothetical protein ACKOQ4_05915 [Mycobacterium sp.]